MNTHTLTDQEYQTIIDQRDAQFNRLSATTNAAKGARDALLAVLDDMNAYKGVVSARVHAQIMRALRDLASANPQLA